MILGERTITRRRYESTSRGTDGRLVLGSVTETSIRASVQQPPAQPVAVERGGERVDDTRRLLTTSDLRTSDQHAPHAADEVEIDGVRYVVRRVARLDAILPHYDVEVVRLAESA